MFGADRPLPESPEGRRLLAHELAHIVQQSKIGAGPVVAARDLDRHGGRASANVIQRDVPKDKPKAAGEETKEKISLDRSHPRNLLGSAATNGP